MFVYVKIRQRYPYINIYIRIYKYVSIFVPFMHMVKPDLGNKGKCKKSTGKKGTVIKVQEKKDR